MKTLLAALAASFVSCAFAQSEGPAFRVDPAWPRPLPEENGVQLVLGQVAGIAVDDAAGAHYVGTELHEVVSSLPGSGGYVVDADGERQLAARLL